MSAALRQLENHALPRDGVDELDAPASFDRFHPIITHTVADRGEMNFSLVPQGGQDAPTDIALKLWPGDHEANQDRQSFGSDIGRAHRPNTLDSFETGGLARSRGCWHGLSGSRGERVAPGTRRRLAGQPRVHGGDFVDGWLPGLTPESRPANRQP